MAKTLSAHEQAISKIFGDDYVFHIPGYQRPYAWTTEQASELFSDLYGFMQSEAKAVEDMAPYFLGSIVLIKEETIPYSQVVDGQQRLTTLTILLAAIRYSVCGESSDELTQLIYERGSSIRGTKDRFRVTLRERDSEFFQSYVQKEGGFSKLIELNEQLSDAQFNIKENAVLFNKMLSELPEAERVRLAQFIVTRCFLVVVETPDLDSAYRIFSVLNSRGLDLSATDILKSEIIGSIPESMRTNYTNKWEDAEEFLGRDDFVELFGHIRMVYRKAKPHGTLLKEFKAHVDEVKQPTKFIDDVLLPMAKAYEEIINSTYESTALAEKINSYLRWLNRLEFTDWVPPALAFFIRYRQKPEQLLNFIRDHERLAYAMLITKFTANERIDRFSKVTTAIENNVDLSLANSPLQLSLEEQYNFYEVLNGSIYLDLAAKSRTALLLKLDSLLSGGEATYEYASISVEHVLPQTPEKESTWTSWFSDPRERIQWTHRLANLVLLSRKKNSAASNYDFDKKKKVYFSKGGVSPFPLTTQVLEHSTWTPAIVEKRQQNLLSTLETHWRLTDRKHPLADL